MKLKREEFLADVSEILRADYACDLASADKKEMYNALSKAVMMRAYDDWKKSVNSEKKRCAYFSAEFLMGRSIFSNLLNLGILEEAEKIMSSVGVDIREF